MKSMNSCSAVTQKERTSSSEMSRQSIPTFLSRCMQAALSNTERRRLSRAKVQSVVPNIARCFLKDSDSTTLSMILLRQASEK